MAYCAVDDLLRGDLQIGEEIDLQGYVEFGAEEIDAALGEIYVVPIPLAALPRHEKLVLKQINVFISSGMLYLALARGQIEYSQYGDSLCQEGRRRLQYLVNGSLNLTGATPTTAPVSTVPRASGADATSAMEAFYDFVMNEDPFQYDQGPWPRWIPGPA